jgi:hypothetical protein
MFVRILLLFQTEQTDIPPLWLVRIPSSNPAYVILAVFEDTLTILPVITVLKCMNGIFTFFHSKLQETYPVFDDFRSLST